MDSGRLVYLDLLRQHCRLQRLSLLGYCLMSNHVHLIVIPTRPGSLRLALKHAHGRYASCFNARHASSGHVWQGRFYSCPLDQPHVWAALRYAELNPVRAGMAHEPEDYAWSSAAAHCGFDRPGDALEMRPWRETWNAAHWREYRRAGAADAETEAIRRSTRTGRPLGAADFVAHLENVLRRPLAPRKGGRPPNEGAGAPQRAFGFGSV